MAIRFNRAVQKVIAYMGFRVAVKLTREFLPIKSLAERIDMKTSLSEGFGSPLIFG